MNKSQKLIGIIEATSPKKYIITATLRDWKERKIDNKFLKLAHKLKLDIYDNEVQTGGDDIATVATNNDEAIGYIRQNGLIDALISADVIRFDGLDELGKKLKDITDKENAHEVKMDKLYDELKKVDSNLSKAREIAHKMPQDYKGFIKYVKDNNIKGGKNMSIMDVGVIMALRQIKKDNTIGSK